jgi:uncharacterized membrane protein YebE (DUF533 family)
MNTYQVLLLVCIYAGVAYRAYREYQTNKTNQVKQYDWLTWFQLATTAIGFFVFLFVFLFLGAL